MNKATLRNAFSMYSIIAVLILSSVLGSIAAPSIMNLYKKQKIEDDCRCPVNVRG